MSFKRKPAYLLHKATGQARVRIDRKDHYLGPHGSPQSLERYNALVTAWFGGGQTGVPISIDCLALLHLQYAKGYYVKDGQETGEVDNLRDALKPLIRLCGTLLAADFGPLKLKTVRQSMIESGLCRTTINRRVDRIRRMFRWAVENEYVTAHVVTALDTVPGLRRERSAAREPEPVMPVSSAIVEATLPHLPKVVADMVSFQRLTGCRPGEVCQIRPCDVDRSDEVWVFRPASHKSQHHGRERRIFVGPKAQAILLPYLLRSPEAYCFSPLESEQQRRAAAHERRKTPLSCGNRPGTNRRATRQHQARDRYVKAAYARAVVRGCAVAFGMPSDLRKISKGLTAKERKLAKERAAAWRAEHCWSPNQLRHTAATEIRQRFGLEAAQAALGHRAADVTQIYAERDFGLAASVAKQIG